MFQQAIFKTFSQNEELVAKRFVKYQEYKNKIEFLKTVKKKNTKMVFKRYF